MNKLIYIFFGLVFSMLVILQIHNIFSHPYSKGFDNQGHLDYISLLQKEKRVPFANEGWGMFQPPLYYILASFTPDFKSVQFLNFFYWLILLTVSYLFLHQTFKNTKLILLGLILIGSLPVILYLTPLVSNEFFTGVIITVSLVYYLLHFQKNYISIWEKLILGFLLGLTLLSKATGVIFLFSIIIDSLFRHKWRLMNFTKHFGISLLIAGFIGGWFYIRNIIYFGNPFILNIDFLPGPLDQLPGYRDVKFFTDLSGFFTFDIFHAHWYSLLPGTYFSWYFDAHNAIVPIQPFSKAGNILVLLTLPLFILSVIGFIEKLIHRSKQSNIFIIFSLFLFLSYIAFTIKVPFYSSVRSTYLISLVLPWCYFVLTGFQKIESRIRWSYIYIYLTSYLIILLRNFWIR